MTSSCLPPASCSPHDCHLYLFQVQQRLHGLQTELCLRASFLKPSTLPVAEHHKQRTQTYALTTNHLLSWGKNPRSLVFMQVKAWLTQIFLSICSQSCTPDLERMTITRKNKVPDICVAARTDHQFPATTFKALQSHNYNSVKLLNLLTGICEMVHLLPLILPEWQGPTAPQKIEVDEAACDKPHLKEAEQPWPMAGSTKACSENTWSKFRWNYPEVLSSLKPAKIQSLRDTLLITNPPTHLNAARLHGSLWSLPTFTGCSLHSQRKNNRS